MVGVERRRSGRLWPAREAATVYLLENTDAGRQGHKWRRPGPAILERDPRPISRADGFAQFLRVVDYIGSIRAAMGSHVARARRGLLAVSSSGHADRRVSRAAFHDPT